MHSVVSESSQENITFLEILSNLIDWDLVHFLTERIVLLLVLSMESFEVLLNVIRPLFQKVFIMLSENSLKQRLILSENSF